MEGFSTVESNDANVVLHGFAEVAIVVAPELCFGMKG